MFAVALATGLAWNHALVAALALALASDAIASEALRARYPTGSPLADTGRQLVLTQHLLLVPIVVFLPALGFERALTEGSPWPKVGIGALLIVALLTVGNAALRHGFRFVVGVGAEELFASFALLAIVGTLLAFGAAGVPLELAALGAGFLLVRSGVRLGDRHRDPPVPRTHRRAVLHRVRHAGRLRHADQEAGRDDRAGGGCSRASRCGCSGRS